MRKIRCTIALLLISITCLLAQVKIGDNPSIIDAASILELESTSRGMLIVRMTTVQRDAIASPPNGLQVYNITTNTLDVFTDGEWKSLTYTNPADNLVYVYSLDDLPTPAGNAITLLSNKMYVFSGIINISPNYLNLNGAGLRGNDPAKDGVMSTVSGGVLRSTGVSVYIENLVVIPASATSKAYDFADATGNMFCNLFSGCSVIDAITPSLGVGQISGFKAVTIQKNYWNCKDGVKLTGALGKLSCSFNFITGITAGSGIEFLSGLVVDDIDLANNYFIYTGQTGVKLNAGATIDLGRMSTNMFRGVTTFLDGFNSYTPGWEMQLNTNIPDSRSYGYLYWSNNATSTSTSPNNTFVKIAGTTTAATLQKFTSPASNRLTYIGKKNIIASVFVTTSARAPANGAEFTLGLAKNGVAISAPSQSTGPMTNNQGFSFSFETEVSLATNDYIEVFLKTTNNNASVTISDLQFRVVD